MTVPPHYRPTVTCPAPVTVEQAAVTLTARVGDRDGDAIMVSWYVDGQYVHGEQVPGSAGATSADVSLTHAFTAGVHTVRVEVRDWLHSPSSCQTTVTVNDNAPPRIYLSVARPELWPPNSEMVEVGFAGSAVDAVDPNPTWRFEVFANEGDEEIAGDAEYSPDASRFSFWPSDPLSVFAASARRMEEAAST